MISFVRNFFGPERSSFSRSGSEGQEEETTDYLPLNDFPDEILVEIFQYTENCDKSALRLVCRRFLDLFYAYPRLRPALVFSNCVLARNQPPVSTIMSSFHDIGFRSLSISDVYWNFESKTGDLSDFWELIGASLSEFTIPDYLAMDEKDILILLKAIVMRFPRLQKLTIQKFCLAELQSSEKVRAGLAFPWIERLKLVSLNLDLPYDWVLEVFPGVRELEIEDFRASDPENVRIFFEKYGAIVVGIKEEQIPTLVYSVPMNLKSLSTSIYTAEEFDHFYDFIRTQSSLRDLELEMNFKKLVFQNLNCLRKLKVNFVDWVCISFEPFEDFPHLQELDIFFGYKTDAEFFGHQILVNPNMRAISLQARKIQLCPDCYKYMLMSYSNLRTIDIYTMTLIEYAEDLFGMFGKYGTNIEKITIRAARKFSLRGSFGYGSYLYNMPPLPKLREIQLMPVGKISEKWFQILCHQCPNLQHVTLYDSINLNGNMIKILFVGLKSIRSVTLVNRRKECKSFNFSLDSILKFSSQLQKLSLQCCNLDCDKMLKLFELSDKLEVVQDNKISITRKDYYLISVLKTKTLKDCSNKH